MQQTIQVPRKPSGGRPPPPRLDSQYPHRPQQQQSKQSFIQPQRQQHMSMPPPSPKTVYPSYATSERSSNSSTFHPSPALSVGSDRSLHESTKINIRDHHTSNRMASANLGWEEKLQTPHETYQSKVDIRDEVELQFDHLLESLQVPASVRQKFETVSKDVKSSILHSSTTSNPTILSSLGLPPNQQPPQQKPKMKKRLSTPLLRKQKSSSSIGSPGANPEVGKTYKVSGDQFVIVASPLNSTSANMAQGAVHTTRPNRGQSMDIPRSQQQASKPSRPLSQMFASQSSVSKSSAKGLGITMTPAPASTSERPEAFITWLSAYKGTDLRMEVSRCKKLRMLLRHESTFWVQEFLELGGYGLVLKRLQDLLDVEWREEQHDDQMLYELLRCVKALSTSEIGKQSLRREFPNPFKALSTLLFSEKKPGDLASRQIIIELFQFIFELFPSPSSSPSTSTASGSGTTCSTGKGGPSSSSSSTPQGGREAHRSSIRFDHPPTPTSSGNNGNSVRVTEVMRSLLVPDIPDPRMEQHEFITQAHRPRVFKAWVGELSDICRDYFWIMCHGSNSLWALDEVDQGLVERPVAPGGATGGVEYEAMNYVTTHFRLLNTFVEELAKEDITKARGLHNELLSSGMDRILVTLRKASTTYYPTLHLQLSIYVHNLRLSSPSAKLPYIIDKLVGSPPEGLRKFGVVGGKEWLPALGIEGGRRGGWDGGAKEIKSRP